MSTSSVTASAPKRRWAALAALTCLLLLPGAPQGQGQGEAEDRTQLLQRLATERELLTSELEQYEQTLAVLIPDDTPPEQSSNPAVRKLAEEVVRLKERLVGIAEQEVTLLQAQIIDARARQREGIAAAPVVEVRPDTAMESKPLPPESAQHAPAHEAEQVERLHELLENYHAELQEAARTLPTENELEQRELAKRDAMTLARIPFNANKVRLTGAEGSTALTEITERLMDPRIPESRRDISPICNIRTRLFGQLIGSESRSLQPVGKHHYVARVRLQPGTTTLSIRDDRWEIRVPEHSSGQDYLVTLYRPPEGDPELHVFAVDDLLALERPHIPAWLPVELDLKPRAG